MARQKIRPGDRKQVVHALPKLFLFMGKLPVVTADRDDLQLYASSPEEADLSIDKGGAETRVCTDDVSQAKPIRDVGYVEASIVHNQAKAFL
jgi:hypothetical protein